MPVKKILEGIPGSSDWTEITRVTKGWSRDQKFRVQTPSGQYQLVRLADRGDYAAKKVEFEAIQRIPFVGLTISRPVSFGLTASKEHVFTVFTWVEGDDAQTVVPTLPTAQQYSYGRQAGRTLKAIHQIPAPPGYREWGDHFRQKAETRLRAYRQGATRLDDEGRVIQYLQDHLALLNGRPQTLQHGDFHLGNMVICPPRPPAMEAALGLIDFNRLSYGDPWEEFERWVFTARSSTAFMNGQIHAYFNDDVPELFFRLMATYTAYSIIASIPWAEPFGAEEMENMRALGNSVIKMYDGYRSVIPNWYHEPQ